MHIDNTPSSLPDDPAEAKTPWYRLMTRYHWFVLVVAALGWLFDCLDQQLFILARPAAMEALVPAENYETAETLRKARSFYGDVSTSIFIAGWATGGLIFGMLGDRWGRAKTMVITILMYSLFTGLSAFSVSVWDFAFYRFLTGLGVGGEFAVGVSLVAEVMPNKARPYTLGLLQALSAIGNLSAAFINLGLGLAEEQGMVESPWRIMFLIGAVPALLALVIRRNLKEPEAWVKMRAEAKKNPNKDTTGSYRELFRDPLWRKHALLGLVLACSGVIGLWSVGFFTPDLIRYVQRKPVTIEVYQQQLAEAQEAKDESRIADLTALLAVWEATNNEVADELRAALSVSANEVEKDLVKVVNGRLSAWGSYASIAINIGAFLGMFGFGALSQKIGRKKTFTIALVAAYISTVYVFLFLEHFWQIWVFVPIMGFCQLSLFAGYAIYFPELFPTRLRSTGISFCYNVGRFVAAFGPLVKSALEHGFSNYAEPFRYSGAAMATIFLLGLLVLPFLPETRWKPLPE